MESAKKVILLLSRLFASAVIMAVFSLPAFAYEEDTHFQMTYVICRSVGFTPEEALIVAAVDQGMDDSPGVVANGGPGGAIPNVEEEWKWHALDGYGVFKGGSMKVSGILARRDQFFLTALREPSYINKLIRLGVFFHYQQDTWGHRHHYVSLGVKVAPYYQRDHLSHDKYTSYNTPTGHAPDGHAPDRPPFDPAAALMNLEEGIVYARRFLKEGLGRTPGTFLADYTPQGGKDDDNWKGSNGGAFFHQIDMSGAAPNSARSYLLNLIRAQIDVYGTSSSPNPRYLPYFTPDEADLDKMRAALNKVCKDFEPYRSAGIPNPAINIPTKAEKVAAGYTNLTTPLLESEMLPPGNALTDGMHIQYSGRAGVFLAIGGKLRALTPNAAGALFAPNTTVELKTGVPYPTADPPLDGNIYLARSATARSQNEIYLVIDSRRLFISDAAALAAYGFDKNKVRTVSNDVLRPIPSGYLNAPNWSFIGKDGMRIHNLADGKYYLIIDRQLREIPDDQTYGNLFGQDLLDGKVGALPVSNTNGYVLGPPLTTYAKLSATNGDQTRVYLIVDGKKRLIVSEAVFNSFGFSHDQINYSDTLWTVADGPTIP